MPPPKFKIPKTPCKNYILLSQLDVDDHLVDRSCVFISRTIFRAMSSTSSWPTMKPHIAPYSSLSRGPTVTIHATDIIKLINPMAKARHHSFTQAWPSNSVIPAMRYTHPAICRYIQHPSNDHHARRAYAHDLRSSNQTCQCMLQEMLR